MEARPFGPHLKGFPSGLGSLARAQIAEQGWQLLRGDLALPLAVIKDTALQHNLRWMRDFCAQRGIDLAPHGKTTMSPELWRMQLDEGAWGISFATVFQASVAVRHGAVRVIIANQVVQTAELDALAQLLAEHPALRALFWVDSARQVDLIEDWARQRNWAGRMEVLLEIGLPGQRTGVREYGVARALGQRIAACPWLWLGGVACYEGLIARCDHASDRAGVGQLMDLVEKLAHEGVSQGWFEGRDEVIISAGGSAIFDLVAERMWPSLAMPVRGILRSGCYLTHDHQRYQRSLCCVGERLQLGETLKPALEVLACVQSCPEPGLALLSMGRRDVSHDLDLPLPIWRSDGRGGAPRGVPDHWHIDTLNDQHAYLRYNAASPERDWPQLGETVASGISHPCTTFDKWRWMPVVDGGYRVIDAVTTCF